jgi:hypothetical protein
MRNTTMIAIALFCVTAPALAVDDFDPETIDPAAVIQCRISAPHYMGFVMTMSSDGEPGSWDKRGWIKMVSPNPMMTQYRLPKPISVFGHETSVIAFTSSAMLAVLDVADPYPLAKEYGIESLPIPGRFMGEKLMSEGTEIDKDINMKISTRVALNLSTVASHPGKTLMGCSYHTDMDPLG